MSEEANTEPELLDCAVRYLASLHTTPDYLARHYPHTYETFVTLSCEQIDVLNRIGAALAQDDPRGDNRGNGEDADEPQDAGEKLKKYLYVIH